MNAKSVAWYRATLLGWAGTHVKLPSLTADARVAGRSLALAIAMMRRLSTRDRFMGIKSTSRPRRVRTLSGEASYARAAVALEFVRGGDVRYARGISVRLCVHVRESVRARALRLGVSETERDSLPISVSDVALKLV